MQMTKPAPLDLHQRELMLLFVAYHSSPGEVERLKACLQGLPRSVGYAVVVNDYQAGEAVEALAEGADYFLCCRDNPGYGRAINRLVNQIVDMPRYLAVMNTDLRWDTEFFPRLLAWLQEHPEVSLAVPQIRDAHGEIQKLCKRDPTLLALLSRRFLPNCLKPGWLKRYDKWYVMEDHDYSEIFDVPYLSGCCMLMRSHDFQSVGGFEEDFFLYLEDADITRKLRSLGRCIHLPIASITHDWGRGNYKSIHLVLVNIHSAWVYFKKWGWQPW
jgi:GT2 family glycosyltransferase